MNELLEIIAQLVYRAAEWIPGTEAHGAWQTSWITPELTAGCRARHGDD